MPKTTVLPPALNLTAAKEHNSHTSPILLSPRSLNSPITPRSTVGSPFLPPVPTHHPENGEFGRGMNGPASPRITAMPEFPPSPVQDGFKYEKERSRSFFSNFKASKSSHRLHSPEASMVEFGDKQSERSRGTSRDRSLHPLKKQGSTPDLPRLAGSNTKPPHEGPDEVSNGLAPPGSSDGSSITQKKGKSKFGGILARNKPLRSEDEKKFKPRPQNSLVVETHALQVDDNESNETSLKTAPIRANHRERAFADIGSTNRAHSADRHMIDHDSISKRNAAPPSLLVSSLPKENSSLLSNISQTGKGVGNRLGIAGKGLFNKMTRSASSNEREVPVLEENYVFTTINLPLMAQTRKTRIARKLELSRDKTEFWMPALPWRCIDYLNMNGSEEEGLYRIPGSGREVKMWQKRFDTEYDINLFEEPELYDINAIGSMFKSWLRELPDEILPKSVQNKISQQCAGATTTPQLLKDELSRLPPFNYYLLFAITCHLSLLHSFAEKNKMDYRNLCICFQPCLKIDALCFQFLVLNWKDCWQGCWTEHEYLQEEYRVEKLEEKGSIASGRGASSLDERAISSSGSSHLTAPNGYIHKSADTGIPRKGSLPHLGMKQRSLSSTGSGAKSGLGHSNSSSVPTISNTVTTPEQKSMPDKGLPQLSDLSPLRM